MAQPAKNKDVSFDEKQFDQPSWLELIRRQVASLQYGVVQIVVHEGRVTQIEKTERLRLEKPQANYQI